MARKPKVDQDELVVASGFGRGGVCKASDQKKHEADAARKPPKPPTAGKTKTSAPEPED